MTKGIRLREFNSFFKNGSATFHRFHGSKARHMKNYVKTPLDENRPDTVIVLTGGNDLQTKRVNPTPVEDIAKDIIEVGKICRTYGVTIIIISSVIIRRSPFMAKRCKELNNILKGMCHEFNFNFIDNDNISTANLAYDGVHLNVDGNIKLAKNFLSILNNI